MEINTEKRIKWHSEIKSLKDIRPYEKNPRVITEQGLKQLGESFNELGIACPININQDGTILSGHARYQQLKSEGATEVDCYVPDRMLTPKQEEAVIIRMNKNVAGTWDFDILANEFEMTDLVEWGFTEIDLDSISRMNAPPEEDDGPDEEPPVSNSEHSECPRCGYLREGK